MLEDLRLTGLRVLEPSCGDGRILQAIAAARGKPFGYEVDAGRAAQARAFGHPVANWWRSYHPLRDTITAS